MLPEIQGGTPMQPKKLVVHGEISLRTPALDDIHAGQRPADAATWLRALSKLLTKPDTGGGWERS